MLSLPAPLLSEVEVESLAESDLDARSDWLVDSDFDALVESLADVEVESRSELLVEADCDVRADSLIEAL